MTPEQLLLEDAARWLKIARSDLKAAEVLIGAGSYSEALFHCQQAAEKALKGLLARHGKPFRTTHDLSGLSADCVEIDPTLDPLLTKAERLTQYVWRFRYPGAPFEPDATEAADLRLLTKRGNTRAVPESLLAGAELQPVLVRVGGEFLVGVVDDLDA